MNNKGFTLIELIATIALLSVIVIISFVSINGVIQKSRVNDCQSLRSDIKAAASQYVSNKRYDKSFVSSVTGTSVAINGNKLVSEGYLSSPIINPFNKNEIAVSKIDVYVTLNADYTVKSSKVRVNGVDNPNFLELCVE